MKESTYVQPVKGASFVVQNPSDKLHSSAEENTCPQSKKDCGGLERQEKHISACSRRVLLALSLIGF